MKKKALKINIGQRRVFGMLLFLLIAFSSLYIYFVSKSVINVVVREEIEQEVAVLHSVLADLESEYIAHKNKIDLSYAHGLGFVMLSEKDFAERKSLASTELTFNSEP